MIFFNFSFNKKNEQKNKKQKNKKNETPIKTPIFQK